MTQPPNKSNKPASGIDKQVLKLIKTHDPLPPGPPHHEPEEEEKIEVDERWLIAYADKMTLLCGLFVMLFAMSNIDKTKFQKVKESAEKSFGKPNADKPKEYVDIENVQSLKSTETKLNEKISQLNIQTQLLEHSTQQKDAVITHQRKQIEELLKSRNTVIQQKTQMEQLDRLVKSQQIEMQELRRKNTAQPVIPPAPVPKPEENQKREVDNLKIKIQDVKGALEISKQEKERLVREITQLKEEIERLKQTQLTSTFISVIMSWSTVEHDVDLSITDPQGKTFDFKHRKYNEHPGTFVLDTRRGPGNEVWQAETIIPGTYKIKYYFYNQYSNKAPCPVTGTFVTPKGSFDLPEITLDLTQKREVTYTVDVDKLGNVKIAN